MGQLPFSLDIACEVIARCFPIQSYKSHAIKMCRSDLQASLDAFPAAIHEFRIPPKALLGLHSYCPVHFDTFHAVVVDISVHITLLKAGLHAPTRKESRFVTGSSFYTDKKRHASF